MVAAGLPMAHLLGYNRGRPGDGLPPLLTVAGLTMVASSRMVAAGLVMARLFW